MNRSYACYSLFAGLLACCICGCAGLQPCDTLYNHEFRWQNNAGLCSFAPQRCASDMAVVENEENQRAVTKVTDFHGMTLSGLSLSADGRTLAFTASGPAGETRIMTADATTGGSCAVAFEKKGCLSESPWVSYGGNDIYFCSDFTGIPRIWIAPLQGAKNGLRELTGGEGAEFEPSVSDDGRIAVFRCVLSGARDGVICVTDESGHVTYLRNGRAPRVSGDGKQIVYLAPGEDTAEGTASKHTEQIWTIDTCGKTARQLTNFEAGCRDASFSPDGRAVVFASIASGDDTSSGKKGDYNIWMADLQEGTAKQLTANASADVSPVWSADGRYIYFCSNRGKNWNIWRLDLDEKLRPRAPVDLKATVEKGGISITWKGIEGRSAGYLLYQSTPGAAGWQKVSPHPLSENSFLVTGLKPCCIYRFKVTAIGQDGTESNDSATVSTITPAVRAPDAVTARPGSNGGITVSWRSAEGANAYNIYMRPDVGKLWWKLNDSPVRSREYLVDRAYLRDRVSYTFKVSSVDSTGFESGRSDGGAAVVYNETGTSAAAAPDTGTASQKTSAAARNDEKASAVPDPHPANGKVTVKW